MCVLLGVGLSELVKSEANLVIRTNLDKMQ